MRVSLGVLSGLVAVAGLAHADSAPPPAPSLKQINPNAAVAAVQTTFDAPAGLAVRLMVYDSEDAFLEETLAKFEAPLDATGLALLPLDQLEPGQYAFAAYLDVNSDGKLNRGKILGRPQEPVAFSNGVKAKLRRPRFHETKVEVAPGSVVVITLDD